MQSDNRLRITEIFHSLQGETSTVGLPTVFVRLTGCPLRCQYCDTAYAFSGGSWLSLDEILQQVNRYQTPYVTVTGGEPLAQKGCISLLEMLCDAGKRVSLETSGAMDVQPVDPRVIKILDLKTPGSAEMSRNLYENLQYLNPADEIKFVLCHQADYEWAKKIISEHQLTDKYQVLFSPSYTELSPKTLADWIVADQLPVRFQMQLHKQLWDDQPGK